MNRWQIVSAVMVWGALGTLASANERPDLATAKPKIVDLEIRLIERVRDDKSTDKKAAAMGKVLTHAEVKQLLEEIKSQPGSNVLCAPRMRLETGKQGNLRTGVEIPVEVPNSKPGENPTLEYLFAGTSLDATVTEPKPGSFIVDITCEQSEQDVDSKEQKPSILKRCAKARAELKSGQTFLLPSVQNERNVSIQSRVALLGEIPVVGNLFTNNRTELQKYELIVLVTVAQVENATELPRQDAVPENLPRVLKDTPADVQIQEQPR